MSKSTISTFQLFALFPDEPMDEALKVFESVAKPTVEEVIKDMMHTYHGLMEDSKTVNGNPSYSTKACANRMIAGEISQWITKLKAVTKS